MIKTIPFALVAAATIGVTEGTTRLIESQSIGLPAACAIVVAVLASGKWLTGKFQEIAVADAQVKTHLADVEIQLKAHLADVEKRVNGQLKAIQRSLDALPCPGKDGKCASQDDETTL